MIELLKALADKWKIPYEQLYLVIFADGDGFVDAVWGMNHSFEFDNMDEFETKAQEIVNG
jgi:hypothetical protein